MKLSITILFPLAAVLFGCAAPAQRETQGVADVKAYEREQELQAKAEFEKWQPLAERIISERVINREQALRLLGRPDGIDTTGANVEFTYRELPSSISGQLRPSKVTLVFDRFDTLAQIVVWTVGQGFKYTVSSPSK